MFTEFLELVEDRFSPELVDAVLSTPGLTAGGAYTAVGTYPSQEWRSLVDAVADATGTPSSDLLRWFGVELVGRFGVLYPELMATADDALSFLEAVEGVIHGEVRKLYPEAELPTFGTRRVDGVLVMDYRSSRGLADLAEGLCHGVLDHFGEAAEVVREDVGGDPPGARFTVRSLGG